MYFGDRAEPISVETDDRQVIVDSLMLALMCKLVRRRVSCQTLDACATCQDYVHPKTCATPMALTRHRDCTNNQWATFKQVRTAWLETRPRCPGLKQLMQTLIDKHQLDVDNNPIEWVKEAKISPRAIFRELSTMTQKGESEDFKLISDEEVETMCSCFMSSRKWSLPRVDSD